ILVTGAAGFIGSHTAERLLSQGHRVIGLDNFNDYYDVAQKKRNVARLKAHESFEMVIGDVRNEKLVGSIFAAGQIGTVVHLAAMAGVRASVDEPSHYFDVNVLGTLNLLEATRRHGLANFVLGSTSSVYGRSENVPFCESEPADRPLAPYPASKR